MKICSQQLGNLRVRSILLRPSLALLAMYALSTGGFQCQCWLGYTGDGVSSCTASPAVNDLPSQYVTEATQGPLICDVMYHIDAPGSAYDPTLIAGLTMNPQVVSFPTAEPA